MLTKRDKEDILITMGVIYVITYILGILNLITTLLGVTITVGFQYFLNRTQIMGYDQFQNRENRFNHAFPMRIGKNVEQAIIIFNCLLANLALIGFAIITTIFVSLAEYMFRADIHYLVPGILFSCLILSGREFIGIYKKIHQVKEKFVDTSFKIIYWVFDCTVFSILLFRKPIFQLIYRQDCRTIIMIIINSVILFYSFAILYIMEILKVGLHIKDHSIELHLSDSDGNGDSFTVSINDECVDFPCSNYYPIITLDGKCDVWSFVLKRRIQADKLVQIKRNSENIDFEL